MLLDLERAFIKDQQEGFDESFFIIRELQTIRSSRENLLLLHLLNQRRLSVKRRKALRRRSTEQRCILSPLYLARTVICCSYILHSLTGWRAILAEVA